jgi:hypothetical protein
MLAGLKDGHVWQSEAVARAPASQGEVVRESAVYRDVCGETAGKIFRRFEQNGLAGRSGPLGNSNRQAYGSALGHTFSDEAHHSRSIPSVA